MVALRLEAQDVVGPNRWRWALTGPGGRALARHDVRLDPNSPQYEASLDLPRNLRRHAAPDLLRIREAEIVRDAGRWLRKEVLGPVADALCAAAPTVAQVVVPADAPGLQNWPLELAWVGGRPLALRHVTLVWQHVHEAVRPVDEPMPRGRRPVRILALFSLPEDSRALNLRRERQTLHRRFAEAARTGRGIEFHGLQYGVTRDRLRSVLARPEGWDLIHISGHGTPGELLLETESGRTDRVSASDLAELLGTARGVSLVTLSACWSASGAVREQHRLLELPDQGDPASDTVQAAHPVGAIASTVVDRLGCAVLAMRYPVIDDFAIDLVEQLYPRLILHGQPLPEALARTLVELARQRRGGVPEALQSATPVLFGTRAAALVMPAPHIAKPSGRSEAPPDALSTAPGAFTRTPPVPERFVGRVALMARADAALARRGGYRGVLLQGMPGVGKTSCAAELADTHGHDFEKVVWFQATRASALEPAPDSTLAELALAMEQAVPELRCVDLLADADRFGELLARLATCMDRRRLLLVIDGIDPLLDGDNGWRDQRWGRLLDALAGPGGAGRLIVTGRSSPRALPPGLLIEPVGLLSRDESTLLTRELPHFASLLNSGPSGKAGAAPRLARKLLEDAQGHPQLLELADGLCGEPGRLTSPAADGRALESAGGNDQLRHVMRAWTGAIVHDLLPEHRDLFSFLCCLEPTDRTHPTVEQNWPELRAQLRHGEAPPDAGLRALAERGLLTPRRSSTFYDIQAELAATGRDLAGGSFRAVIDKRLAAYWVTVFRMAWQREGTDTERAHLAGPLIARAGLSAAPYLARQNELLAAEVLLEAVLRRDPSRSTIALVNPLLRQLASLRATSGGQPLSGALDLVLEVLRPEEAAKQARIKLEKARSEADFSGAAAAAGSLLRLCVRTGRLKEALELADVQIDCARQAGLGPWARLHSEVQRVHVLAESQHAEQALTEAAELLRRIEPVPRERAGQDGVSWWEVWEELHESAQRAAIRTGRWQQALNHNAELCRTKEARGAPAAELAQARFPTYMPLAQLGRTDEALALLDECRVRLSGSDSLLLGEVLGALGNVEHLRGHGDIAIARAQDSLRHAYLAGNASFIAIGHANLGSYLHEHARDGAQAAAHHLAAALLGRLTSSIATSAVQALADDLHEFGQAAEPPTAPERLSELAGQVPGVRLDGLLRQLAPHPTQLRDTLTNLVVEARRLADRFARRSIREAVWAVIWDPVVAALVAAARGNTAAYIQFRKRLIVLENFDPQFAELPAVLRRIYDGERGPHLLAGLGPLDASVAMRAQDALVDPASTDTDLWPAMPLGLALGNIVATATGHTETAVASREALAGYAADPVLAPMASVLNDIVAGSRDSGLLTRLNDATQRAVVRMVLHHIGNVEETNA